MSKLVLQALQRIGREHVVEGPGVTNAGDGAVGGVEDLAFGCDPDVGVGIDIPTRVGGHRYPGMWDSEGVASSMVFNDWSHSMAMRFPAFSSHK